MLTQWDKIKAAERMQAHIEAHLGDPVTMAALARAARYSQWHAARLFKEVTGKSPFEYVRCRWPCAGRPGARRKDPPRADSAGRVDCR